MNDTLNQLPKITKAWKKSLMSGFDHLGVAVGGGHLGKMNSFESLSEFIL